MEVSKFQYPLKIFSQHIKSILQLVSDSFLKETILSPER